MSFFDKIQVTLNITIPGHTDTKLIGYSRGAFKTGLCLAPFDIFLDAGICSHIEPSVILLTHGHADHIGELYSILIANTRKDKVQIITSSYLIKQISYYLNSMATMSKGSPCTYNKWSPINILDKHQLVINNKLIEIDSYKMDHTIDTIGFGISEIRNKLKEEYIGKSKEELIQIKKTTPLMESVKFPLLFFGGDTGYKIIESLPFDVYPVIIIESTYLNPEHEEKARQKKHLIITDLETYFEKYQYTQFVLIHFSCIYKIDEIKEYQKIYETKYNNVKFFI
jgi:ribonuclease Z